MDAQQARAWARNRAAVEATTDQEWALLEWWFTQPDGPGDVAQYRRRSLSVLLNNWADEIIRAGAASKKTGGVQGAEKKEPPPDWREIITSQCPDFSLREPFWANPESIRAVVWEEVRRRGAWQAGISAPVRKQEAA